MFQFNIHCSRSLSDHDSYPLGHDDRVSALGPNDQDHQAMLSLRVPSVPCLIVLVVALDGGIAVAEGRLLRTAAPQGNIRTKSVVAIGLGELRLRG